MRCVPIQPIQLIQRLLVRVTFVDFLLSLSRLYFE